MLGGAGDRWADGGMAGAGGGGGKARTMVGRWLGCFRTENGRRTEGRCWCDSDQIVSDKPSKSTGNDDGTLKYSLD